MLNSGQGNPLPPAPRVGKGNRPDAYSAWPMDCLGGAGLTDLAKGLFCFCIYFLKIKTQKISWLLI